MSQRRRHILRALGSVLSILARPFSSADSLKAYSNSGYLLLGLLLAVFTAILWLSGWLLYPLSRANPWIRAFYKFTTEHTVLHFIPDSLVLLIAVPLIVYVVVGVLWPSMRRRIGEWTANSFFWTLSRAIGTGEWFIENRWWALVFIIAMVIFLSLGISRLVRESNQLSSLTQGLDHWLMETEEFIQESAFVKKEPERYAHVQHDWNNEFERILQLPGGYVHPGFYLHKMLETLYSDDKDSKHGRNGDLSGAEVNLLSWKDELRSKLPVLTGLMDECKTSLRSPLSAAEESSWDLLNVLMGRIYVRLSRDSKDFGELEKARDHFNAVQLPRYQATANNGRGTIYANAFSAYLPGTPGAETSPDALIRLNAICSDSYRCAVEAFRSYQGGAGGGQSCSFQDKRRMNNIVDLLMRIAMQYDSVAANARAAGLIEEWIRTREALADEIEKGVENLMKCNDKGPIIPTTFVTAAQALGASATLRIQSGQDGKREAISAASYLRIANSMQPVEQADWDVYYFCFAASNSEVSSVFQKAFTSNFVGLPSNEQLLRRIQRTCQVKSSPKH